MALFFDSGWFDDRLTAAGLSHATLAAALGISQSELAEMWKDQRELSVSGVRIIAGLLGVAADDVAAHAGISTTAHAPEASSQDISDRLARIEAALVEIRQLLLDAHSGRR